MIKLEHYATAMLAVALFGVPVTTQAADPEAEVRIEPSVEVIAERADTRIEVGSARVDGIPLRRPLERTLVGLGGDVLVAVEDAVLGPIDPRPRTVDEADALALVAQSGRPGSKGATTARLMVEATAARTSPIFVVDPPYDPATGVNARFVVDAIDGSVRVVGNRARDVGIRAYAHNPAVDEDYQLWEIESIATGSQRLRGPTFHANNCVPDGDGWCEPVALATPTNDEGDFLYYPPQLDAPGSPQSPLDGFAEGSAYVHAERFMAWLSGFDFPGLMCTQRGEPATLVVNYRYIEGGDWAPFDNARFTGDCEQLVLLGQAERVDFAYDGDIIAHELGHGVVETQLSNGYLGARRARSDAMVNDAGALNEAFADFLANAYMGDPQLGEYIGVYGRDQPSVRNSDNTYGCPATFTGQVHNDSQAFAGALWAAFELYGMPMVDATLDTLALLPEDATVEIASNTFVNVTRAKLGQAAGSAVQGVFEERGLTDCERFVGVDEVRSNVLVYPPGDMAPFTPPPLQVVVDVPAWAATFTVRFSAAAKTGSFEEPGDIEPGLLIERGQPIVFSYEPLSTSSTLVRHTADTVVGRVEGNEFTTTTDGAAQIYLGFINTGESPMQVSDIEIAFAAETPTEGGDESGESSEVGTATTGLGTDTDIDTLGETLDLDDDSDKSGCSCNTGPKDAGWWLGALLFAFGFVRRRR